MPASSIASLTNNHAIIHAVTALTAVQHASAARQHRYGRLITGISFQS